MSLTAKDYQAMCQRHSPPSKLGRDVLFAFLIGGLICTLGEFFIELYRSLGADQQLASGGASVTLVFLSALLTGLKRYDEVARVAGAGTLVPITGFANAVAAPALEFKSEGIILGLGAKIFTIAGPVILYGTLASVAYGVVLYLFGLV